MLLGTRVLKCGACRVRRAASERADDPPGRFRDGWRLKARDAKDTRTAGTQLIETAMEGSLHEAIKFAAEFLEAEGQAGLAIKLRARVSSGRPDRDTVLGAGHQRRH